MRVSSLLIEVHLDDATPAVSSLNAGFRSSESVLIVIRALNLGIELSDVDVSGVDLSEVDLSEVDLSMVDLSISRSASFFAISA